VLLVELKDMGFQDETKNASLLRENNMSVAAVVGTYTAEMVSQLEARGFSERTKNERMLQEHRWDVDAVAAAISAEREAYLATLMSQAKKRKQFQNARPPDWLGNPERHGPYHE